MSNENEKNEKNEKQVAKKESTIVSYNYGMWTGADNMSGQDVDIQRFKVCQPMTQVKDEIEGLADGMLYSTFGEILGKKTEFFILWFYRSKTWFNESMKFEASCSFVKGREVWIGNQDFANDNNNDCIDNFNYFVVDARKATSDPIGGFGLLSVTPTGIRNAKKMNAKLFSLAKRGIPFFAQKVTVTSKLTKFDKGSAFVPQFELGQPLNPSEHGPMLKSLEEMGRACESYVGKIEIFSEHEDVQENTYAGDSYEYTPPPKEESFALKGDEDETPF